VGYRSSVYGNLAINKGKHGALMKFLKEDDNFGSYSLTTDALEIHIDDWKMYMARDFFERLAEFCTGGLSVEGEDQGDVWNMKFEGGKLFVQGSHIEWELWSDDDKVKEMHLGAR
jgi:hypothetical protein